MCKIVSEFGTREVDLREETGYGGIGNSQAVTDAENPDTFNMYIAS